MVTRVGRETILVVRRGIGQIIRRREMHHGGRSESNVSGFQSKGRSEDRKVSSQNLLRVYANCQLVVGHFVLLYVSMLWGLVLCFSSNMLLMPWAMKDRLWDVVAILSFFSVIEGGKLVEILVSG